MTATWRDYCERIDHHAQDPIRQSIARATAGWGEVIEHGPRVDPRQRQSLTEAQLAYAVDIGEQQAAFAQARGLTWLYAKTPRYQTAAAVVVGCIGELAFAEWGGVPWQPTVGQMNSERGDVDGWEVRTGQNDFGKCYIRRRDHPHRRVALVTGLPPHFVIRGSILASAARAHPEWRVPDTAEWDASYAVPPAALTMAELYAWKERAHAQ